MKAFDEREDPSEGLYTWAQRRALTSLNATIVEPDTRRAEIPTPEGWTWVIQLDLATPPFVLTVK